MNSKLLNIIGKFYGNVKYNYISCSDVDSWVEISIKNATNDLMPRTLSVRKKIKSLEALADEISNKKSGRAIDSLIAKIKEWLTCTSNNKADFDNWHNEACSVVLNVLNIYYRKKNSSLNVPYGKAQKIVNMAFKYMYCSMWCLRTSVFGVDENLGTACISGCKFKIDKFEHCHMPLDSFILEWFNRRKIIGKKGLTLTDKSGNKFIKGNVDEWSNLEYVKTGKKYEYNFFVKEIRALFTDEADFNSTNKAAGYVKYISDKKTGKPCFTDNEFEQYTPLQAEFFIWDKIKRELAAEEYLLAFSDEFDKAKLITMSLKEKIAEVIKISTDYLVDQIK